VLAIAAPHVSPVGGIDAYRAAYSTLSPADASTSVHTDQAPRPTTRIERRRRRFAVGVVAARRAQAHAVGAGEIAEGIVAGDRLALARRLDRPLLALGFLAAKTTGLAAETIRPRAAFGLGVALAKALFRPKASAGTCRQLAQCLVAAALERPEFPAKTGLSLWQFRHQFPAEMCFQWRLFSHRVQYCVPRSQGASMRMRLRVIAVLAVLTASFALGGCFHHNQSVMVEPQSLPPLK
jgi:hypothetical protein